MSTVTQQKPPARAVTGRAVLVGLVLTAFLATAIPYSDNRINSTWISCCHLPIVVFVLFLLLVAVVNAALRRVAPDKAFSNAELVVIYAMMLVGAGIPSFQLTEYLFPTLAGVRYFATPENRWEETFFRYIPDWLAPTDEHAIRAFFEGLAPGQTIPWRPWLVPTLAWTALALALFWTYACAATILRKQWVENEHLLFPLVQLPLDMLEEEPGRVLSPFLRSKAMWLGAAIPLFIHSWNGFHAYFPVVPHITLTWHLNQYFRRVPWNQMGPVIAIIHFSIIGFTFLLATDLSFSLWFFFILFNLLSVALYAAGVKLPPIPNYATKPEAALQMLGAFFLVCGYILYLLRPHLRDVIARAMGSTDVDDSGEPLPYSVAFWGFWAGIAAIALWCSAAGMRAWVAVLSFLLLMVIALVLSRLISEAGLLFVQAPFRATDIYSNTVGTGWLTPQDLTIHAFVQRVFMLDLRTFVMPSFLDSFKLAFEMSVPLRRLMPALALAIIVSIAFSYGSMLYTAYHYGGLSLSGWFCKASPQQPFKTLVQWLSQPQKPTLAGWIFILVGAAITWLLSLARMRFTWWPLHPLGYAMGPSWPMIQLWFSTLIGWLCKTLVMRYATVRSYRTARHFFLGLVVGEFLAAGIWVFVAWVTATRGYRFFLF